MINPGYTADKSAEPKYTEKYKIGDRVRVKRSAIRNPIWINDLAGVIGCVDQVHNRIHNPYHIAGCTVFFYEDELELVHNLETSSKQIPNNYMLGVNTNASGTKVYRYEPKIVKFFDWKEIAE